MEFCKQCARGRQKSNRNAGLKHVAQRKFFYSRRMGPKLKEAMQELLEAPLHELVSVESELVIMRKLCDDAFGLYAAAYEMPDDNPKRQDLLLQAAQIQQMALKEVVSICRAHAEISANQKDKLPITALDDIVAQITHFVHIAFGHDEPALDAFDRLLTEQLRLPKVHADGTVLTPDMDAIEMDASVPAAPDVDAVLPIPKRKLLWDEFGGPHSESLNGVGDTVEFNGVHFTWVEINDWPDAYGGVWYPTDQLQEPT